MATLLSDIERLLLGRRTSGRLAATGGAGGGSMWNDTPADGQRDDAYARRRPTAAGSLAQAQPLIRDHPPLGHPAVAAEPEHEPLRVDADEPTLRPEPVDHVVLPEVVGLLRLPE